MGVQPTLVLSQMQMQMLSVNSTPVNLWNQICDIANAEADADAQCEWALRDLSLTRQNQILQEQLGPTQTTQKQSHKNICSFFFLTGTCPEPGGKKHSTRTGATWPYNVNLQVTYTQCSGACGGGTITCQQKGTWTDVQECTSKLRLLLDFDL